MTKSKATIDKYMRDVRKFLVFIRGKDIYRSRDMLFGYSMDSISALELEDISDDYKTEEKKYVTGIPFDLLSWWYRYTLILYFNSTFFNIRIGSVITY